LAGNVSTMALSIATAFFFVLAYAIFMAADASRYATAPAVFGVERAATIERATRFSGGVRRYFVVNASFGAVVAVIDGIALWALSVPAPTVWAILDRKSTRLNSSHVKISYAVFCLKITSF